MVKDPGDVFTPSGNPIPVAIDHTLGNSQTLHKLAERNALEQVARAFVFPVFGEEIYNGL